jgi:hypothetical protein
MLPISCRPSLAACLERKGPDMKAARILPGSPVGEERTFSWRERASTLKRRHTENVHGPERIGDRRRNARQFQQLGRRFRPRSLQTTMLDEDIADSSTLLCGDYVEDRVEEFRVVDQVSGGPS